MPAHYFIQGLPHCTGPSPGYSIKGTPPLSIAVFCPRCGEVWARRLVDGAESWIVYNAPCRDHSGWGGPPGSLSRVFTEQDFEALPLPVLRRELNLWIEYHEGKFE